MERAKKGGGLMDMGETFIFTQPVTFLQFMDGDGEEIGRLDWKKGKFTFTGDVEKSAQGFFDYLQGFLKDYVEENC